MSRITLLERLSALEEPRLIAGRTPDRQLRESIVDHLNRLLNTRAGSVPVDPDYGMPDMSNIAGSFAVGTAESVSEAMLRQIARYEPRLRSPRMNVEEENRDVITLRFELAGQISSTHDGDAVQQPFAMVIRVNSSGRVLVQSREGR
jgi:type VI secretion system protein